MQLLQNFFIPIYNRKWMSDCIVSYPNQTESNRTESELNHIQSIYIPYYEWIIPESCRILQDVVITTAERENYVVNWAGKLS